MKVKSIIRPVHIGASLEDGICIPVEMAKDSFAYSIAVGTRDGLNVPSAVWPSDIEG
jgi:hypothetical protein